MSLLARIAVVAGRRYKLVFAVFAVLLLASVFAITRLSFDTDVLDLLPQEEPVVREFIATLEDFGNIDYLLVALRIPEGAVISPYQTYADRLAERLEAMPQVEAVEYRLSDVQELFEEFATKAVLYLPPEERERLAERVTPDALERRAQEMKRLLTTPQGAALRDLLVLDPFGLVEIFMDRVQGSQGQLSIDWQSGYYLSRDRTLLLMLVEVVEPPQNIPYAEALVTDIEAQAAAVTAEWDEITGGEVEQELEEGEIAFDPTGGDDLDGDGVAAGAPPPPPELALGGSYLTNVDEARFIKRDAIINICTSLVLVLSLFLLAFRRLGPLLYAIVPLLSGLLLTFGFAAVTLGRLSTATSGTAALLIGLGIDFIIVSYGRFVEERRLGHGLDEAVRAMATYSGRAVVVGAVTTAATFFAFLVTDFRGLWEMGFLTGTGILFCMVSVLLLLPALFAWHEDRRENRDGTVPPFYLHGFGTDAVIRYSLRRPKVVLGLGVLLTIALGIATTGLRFEGSMAAMRPKGNRGIEVAQEIGDKFGSGFNYMMLVVRGTTAAEALERTAAAATRAESLVDEGILYRVDSATTLIPPPERQREVLSWLEAERAGRLDMARVRADFETALAAENLRATPFEEGIELFEAAVSPREPLGVDDYQGSAEARRLLGRYLQHTEGEGWKSVVYLFPPENRYRREPPPEAFALADELGPDVRLVGNNVVNQFVRVRIKKDAWFAGLLGFTLVAVLIFLDFRRLRDTIGALTPLLVGIVWMLGTMALLGIDVNFMNIFVTTMIIGIGVDYGLHVLHRYRETVDQGPEELERGLLETGKAILVAALSTICGFGSMSISHYPGLRTTGYVAILGALATSLVAITLLPAWFALRREWKARRR